MLYWSPKNDTEMREAGRTLECSAGFVIVSSQSPFSALSPQLMAPTEPVSPLALVAPEHQPGTTDCSHKREQKDLVEPRLRQKPDDQTERRGPSRPNADQKIGKRKALGIPPHSLSQRHEQPQSDDHQRKDDSAPERSNY